MSAKDHLSKTRALWYPVGHVSSILPPEGEKESTDVEEPEKPDNVYEIEGEEVKIGKASKQKKKNPKPEFVDLNPRMAVFVTFKEIDQAAVYLHGDHELTHSVGPHSCSSGRKLC